MVNSVTLTRGYSETFVNAGEAGVSHLAGAAALGKRTVKNVAQTQSMYATSVSCRAVDWSCQIVAVAHKLGP